MAPSYLPLIESFKNKFQEIDSYCNCNLLELDIDKIIELVLELYDISYDMPQYKKFIENYTGSDFNDICRYYQIRTYIAKFARLINTLTPEWSDVIIVLHHWYEICNSTKDLNVFHSIGTLHQQCWFSQIWCEDCSDDLIESNLSGVDLNLIISSYTIASTLTDVGYMTGLKDETIKIFIQNIYYPDQFQRNMLKAEEHDENFRMGNVGWE